MPSPLTLTATFVAQPEARSELRGRLIELVELTRSESGCVFYDLYECEESPNRFVFVERWNSKEAWQAHEATEHVQRIIRDAPRLVVQPIEVVELRSVV